jgi:hypothetical protein
VNRVKYRDIMPADKRDEQLKKINVELVAFSQKKMLTLKREILGGRVLTKPVNHNDISEALKAEGVHCTHIIFYKVLGITGVHHIIVDGIKMLLKIEPLEVFQHY